MAYSAEQLAALQAALASGALRVQYGDRSVLYRSVEELRDAIATVEAGIAEQSGTVRHTRSFARFSKG